MREDHLLNEIEDLRQKLCALGKEKSLNDPEIVSMSQMLDKLLNEFQFKIDS